MEALFDYVVGALTTLADKYTWVSIIMMIIGGAYVLLTALRGFITGIVTLTKTKKDNEIVLAVYAFLDKFAYGFGKFSDYYEGKIEKK